MIPYSRQSVDAEDIDAVVQVLKSDLLTQGPAVKAFESALARYCGVTYAVVFSSGTAALHAAYSVAGLKKGDEFITSPLTFAATANAGLYLGAMPVFADIDTEGNLDPRETEKRITKHTRVIVVVDYAGLPGRLLEFRHLARKHNLVLIEDACHALGADYRGKKVGSWSDLTVFSFHPVKSITTGEGGAVVTGSRDYYEKLKLFRTHGITKNHLKQKTVTDGAWYYEMQALGFNYRMTDIQAALGLCQLKRLRHFIKRRRALANRYDQSLLRNQNIILPRESEESRSSWHLYPIRLAGRTASRRVEIFRKLRRAGIGVQVHYIPVYFHPYYGKLGYKKGLCPQAEAFYAAELSIPLFPDLSQHDQDFVIKTIHELTEL